MSPQNASENISQPSKSFSKTEIFKAWWKAARPPFYVATLVPLFLGWLTASKFSINSDMPANKTLVFCGVLAVCFLQHLCANLANDLFDYLAGIDSVHSIGGSGGLTSGKITTRQLKIALVTLYAASIVLTGVGVGLTGLQMLWLIIAFATLSSYFYVAPPIRYGYRALGEVMVFINMGVVMLAGTHYSLTGEISAKAIAISLPIGLMVAGILYYQSLPEIETDKAAGKITLAALIGAVQAVFLFYIWWPVVWLLMITLWLCGVCSWPVLAGIAASIPLHIKTCYLLKNVGENWLSLDQYGWLVRVMYILCGGSLIWALAVM